MKKEEFITLAKFTSAERAQLTKALLDSMGIENQIIHDTAMSVLPPMPNQIVIVVNASDFDRAKELLEAKFDKNEFMLESSKK